MKKYLLLILFFAAQFSFAQNVNIPDENFKSALISAGYDTGGDGEISVSEAEAVTGMIMVNRKKIVSVEGIEAFVNTIGLSCIGNDISSMDLSANTSLMYLSCSRNGLTSLDLSANPALEKLSCSSNELNSINVSANPELDYLSCSLNNLTDLNLSSNPKLITLNCGSNDITSLDLSANTALVELYCKKNELSVLDVSANTQLSILSMEVNSVPVIDLSSNLELTELYCSSNDMTELDVSANINLTNLSCDKNLLMSICVSDVAAAEANVDFVKDFDAVWLDTCGQNALGINDSDNTYVSVYPIPAVNLLNIDLKVKAVGTVYDMNGKVIMDGIKLSKGHNELNLDLIPQKYFLMITGQGLAKTLSFVVM
ncbi:MAG: hypothetical protein ABFR62_12085 [Bacteroidota bacterium]